MEHSVCFYLIPVFLLLASAGIAGWTGYVVYDDHSVDTLKHQPKYIPTITLAGGIIAAIVFLANLFRVLGCTRSSGWCDSGLGIFTFVLMMGVAASLYVQAVRLNKDERDYYEHELEHYYELTIGQGIYFAVYFMLIILQFFMRMSKCCSSCSCCSSKTDLESGNTHKTMYV